MVLLGANVASCDKLPDLGKSNRLADNGLLCAERLEEKRGGGGGVLLDREHGSGDGVLLQMERGGVLLDGMRSLGE